jgi:hypothetical protein
LPKDWSPVKRWALGVSGEEREALELLLGEREYLSKQIAEKVKETYSHKVRVVLIDHDPC